MALLLQRHQITHGIQEVQLAVSVFTRALGDTGKTTTFAKVCKELRIALGYKPGTTTNISRSRA
jgi:hypothetical protein